MSVDPLENSCSLLETRRLWHPTLASDFSSQVLVEASDLNAVQFCRKELKNQEVADDEMQAGPGGQARIHQGWDQDGTKTGTVG